MKKPYDFAESCGFFVTIVKNRRITILRLEKFGRKEGALADKQRAGKQHQENHKQRRGQNPLRIFAQTIDPVHILLCIAHQVRERQDHQHDNCLPEKSAVIVAEPVQHPEK